MGKLKLGLIVGLREDLYEPFEKVKSFGIPTCQVSFLAENIGKFNPQKVREVADESGIEISCVFFVFKSQFYNFKYSPSAPGHDNPAR